MTHLHTHMHVFMDVCAYLCVYLCMYVCTYLCIYMRERRYECIRKYIRAYVRAYVCIYVCSYAYMYACMPAYMHACMCARAEKDAAFGRKVQCKESARFCRSEGCVCLRGSMLHRYHVAFGSNVWSNLRRAHLGVLRLPYGVIFGDFTSMSQPLGLPSRNISILYLP